MSDTPKEQRIKTRCPACNSQSLFISDNGELCCSWIKCPDPVAINKAATLTAELAEARKERDRLNSELHGLQLRSNDFEQLSMELRTERDALRSEVEALHKSLIEAQDAKKRYRLERDTQSQTLRQMREALETCAALFDELDAFCWDPEGDRIRHESAQAVTLAALAFVPASEPDRLKQLEDALRQIKQWRPFPADHTDVYDWMDQCEKLIDSVLPAAPQTEGKEGQR